MNHIVELFARAYRKESLTPPERSVLRLIGHTLIACAITAFTAVLTLTSHNSWRDVTTTFISTFSMALIASFVKWLTSLSDKYQSDGVSVTTNSEINSPPRLTVLRIVHNNDKI